jgi:type IV secretion system protein VirD4
VCIDIKRENWTVTAGYRAACGQACFLFDPFAEDGRTARWNPLHYVSSDPRRRVNDLQRIAEMLFPDPPGDTFWAASARAMFFGIALYVFETPSEPKTIGQILRLGMATDEEGFGAHWKRIIHGRNANRFPLSPECTRALYDLIDLSPVTASSIRKTFTSRLDLWQNPILDAATSGNDFDLRDLRKRSMSIYVGVNPDDLHRLRPVLALFFQQAIGLQTRELPEHNPALKVPVMMLLDEFTALGRIPIIAEAISYLPGYNVRVVLVIQTPSQLKEVYGINNADTMLKSLAARIVFAPKDYADAREISDELGNTTVKVRSLSRPVMDFESNGRRGRSETLSEQKRALLLPQEVKELGPEEALVFYEGLRPIRAVKIRYFRDPAFRDRLLAPPEVPEMPTLPVAAERVAVVEKTVDVEARERAAPPSNAAAITAENVETVDLEEAGLDLNPPLDLVKAPGEAWTVAELERRADHFLASLGPIGEA